MCGLQGLRRGVGGFWSSGLGTTKDAVKEAAWRPRAVSALAGVAQPLSGAPAMAAGALQRQRWLQKLKIRRRGEVRGIRTNVASFKLGVATVLISI